MSLVITMTSNTVHQEEHFNKLKNLLTFGKVVEKLSQVSQGKVTCPEQSEYFCVVNNHFS